ncbi:MAG: hypothetical protein OEM15_16520 [Myxococcales bacterium]|nr:hypothetical protein [Myxococcales bacterium]MDH3485226.1 hypothetical protein [Myxococcales bacterium]
MNEEELKALYASFAEVFANGTPIRRPIELVAAIRAAGIEPKAVTTEWLRTLNEDWVYGKAILPFQDAVANRLYQQILRG